MPGPITATILTTCGFPVFKIGNKRFEAIKQRFNSDSETDKTRYWTQNKKPVKKNSDYENYTN
jgi:hypothetical protein